jgi:hypothetical protein
LFIILRIVIAPKHTKEIALDTIVPAPNPIKSANTNLVSDALVAIIEVKI